MIDAVKVTGELVRPHKEGDTGRCYACGEQVRAVGVGMLRDLRWAHRDRCPGIGDNWRKRMVGLLVKAGFAQTTCGVARGKVAILLSDGPEPDDDVDERELDWITEGYRVVWLVDGRGASLAVGSSAPGLATPSFMLGAEWSPFTKAWLLGREVPVVIHCSHVPGWGSGDDIALAPYFVAELADKEKVRRRRDALAHVPAKSVGGRFTTLRDVCTVASRLGDDAVWNARVTVRGMVQGGESTAFEVRSARAPWTSAPVHTLDLPPWSRDNGGQWVRVERTYQAHLQHMKERRGRKAAATQGAEAC